MFERAQKTWYSSAPDSPKTAFNAHWRKNKAIYFSVFQAMPHPDFGNRRAECMRIITQACVDNYISVAQTPPIQLAPPSAGCGVKRERGSPVNDMLHGHWVKAEHPDSPDSSKASFSFAEHVQQPAAGVVAVKQELVDSYEAAAKKMRV